MPDMEPAAGAEPQQTQTVPAGGEQPQTAPAITAESIENLSEDEMRAHLFGGELPVKSTPSTDAKPQGEAPGETPKPAEKEPEPETPAGEQPQETAPEPTPQDQPQSLERISLKSFHPDDRKLIADAKEMVRSGKAANVTEAILALAKPEEGRSPQPSPAANQEQPENPEPASPAPPVEQDPEVAAIVEEIAALRNQRKEAIQSYQRDVESELTDQIEDKLAQLAEAKAAALFRNRESATQQSALDATIQDVYVKHPDSEDPTSFFSYRLTQEMDAYEDAHGSIARYPQQLMALADKVAAEIAPKQETRTPAQPQAARPAPAAQPRQTARPLGTAAPGSSASVRHSPDDIQRLLHSEEDPEVLRTALFGSV